MMELIALCLVASALVVSAGRFTVPGHGLSWPGTYEAIVHIWVGVMLTLAVLFWGLIIGYLCAALLVAATALETVMFLYGVKTGKFKTWLEQPTIMKAGDCNGQEER